MKASKSVLKLGGDVAKLPNKTTVISKVAIIMGTESFLNLPEKPAMDSSSFMVSIRCPQRLGKKARRLLDY